MPAFSLGAAASLGMLFHPVTGKRLLSFGMILPEHLINEI
jgi:hypothetical protein